MEFSCPRTCPQFGNAFCRFRPLLDLLGPVQVDSQTARITVDYRDPKALEATILSLGGKWLGQGSHRLFEGPVVGLGFQLLNWRYPCILDAKGELHYDTYGGSWGNEADLEVLKSAYCLTVVERSAQNLGWLCERTPTGELRVFHPNGGVLNVAPGGAVDLTGFTGGECHSALLSLGLPLTDVQAKPEFAAVAAQVQMPARD